MTYVGIDFSLNSTSICVDVDDTIEFYNIIRPKSVSKKILCLMDDLNISYTFTNNFNTTLSYSDTQIDKLIKAIEISDIIVNILSNYKNIKLGCEGLSYGNIGSRALDIAGFHYILRYYLNSMVNIDDILYIPPTEIKKFAVKGNADKKMMYDSFVELDLDESINIKQMISMLSLDNNYKKIPKPVDDMIDAYYIMEYIKKK